ncbi:T cell activation RhoGTPase activating protein b [Paramormyrops kingsleyae]|uniref:T cell activation RhoGTPase activating protein b n=1 Tax=Paramormyrops kingsleyae TaxID=1676925 RepID=A0A3B3QEN0_9TELE|nr:T-cell activation Rho GTPase-activating protein [Paramormyrops kingsleyae]
MKVPSSSVVSKTVILGDMDSLMEGNVKPTPQSEKLSNADERVAPPTENGNSNNRWSFLRKSKKILLHPNTSKTTLFGQLLSNVCDENENLPKPITEMLTLLLKRGSITEGVFRRAGNSKCLKELKAQLNEGLDIDMETQSVILLAALFKDFLRELPGSLLVAELYKDWMMALEKKDEEQRCTEIKRVTDKLPRPNAVLLQHLLCVLHHVSKNANASKMDARNLAVCIAPNLLRCDNLADVEEVTALTQFLIENCCEIFGEHVQKLLGDPDKEEQADNSDLLSSHQHDSAYDSTDPDADGDVEGAKRKEQTGEIEDQCSPPQCKDDKPSILICSSNDTKFVSRRCSEPSLFPFLGINNLKVLARSHDDFSMEKEDFALENNTLKKQNSDSVLQPGQSERLLGLQNLSGMLTIPKPTARSKDCSYSSNCSLESSLSNLSENSVFTSSPLSSPPNSRKSSYAREEVQNQEKEVKRRTSSIRNEKKKPTRAMSWAALAYNRGSLKKGDSQKEMAFSCEILQEDSQNETESTKPTPRPRPLSAIEVFQRVDSKIPAKPPSYEQTILGFPLAPPNRRMTVQDAWMMERKSRPTSMTEDLLGSCSSNSYTDCCLQMGATDVRDTGPAEQAVVYRQRAMSESISKRQQERVVHRCSQPLFEEMTYAKESYV